MATAKEIQEVLGIPLGTWNSWVADGTLAKRPQGKYEFHEVHDQIVKHQKRKGDEYKKKYLASQSRLKMLEKKMMAMEVELQGGGGVTGDDGEPRLMQPKTLKEKMEIKMAERRIRKMDMDEAVRRKQLIPLELLTEIVSQIATTVSSLLKPVPMMVKRNVPELPAYQYDQLVKDVNTCQAEMESFQSGEAVTKYMLTYEPKGFLSDGDDE